MLKRLKALSRRELMVARDVGKSTLSGFGSSATELREATVKRMKMLANRQEAHFGKPENYPGRHGGLRQSGAAGEI